MAYKHFKREDMRRLKAAETFEELRDIAFLVLARMPQPLGQVCGPITSGGLGSTAKNIRKMRGAIRRLKAQGLNIFDQMPFEDPMQRMRGSAYFRGENHLLETFYLPIFESGFIATLHFLPDWQSSYGARWEHAQALRLDITIQYLTETLRV